MIKHITFILLTIGLLLVAQDESTILHSGTYQAEDAGITSPDSAKVVDVDGAEGGKALETESTMLTAQGTEIKLRWKTEGQLIVEVNDEIILFDPTVTFGDPIFGVVYSNVLKRKLHSMVASLYLQFSALVETDVEQNHDWYEAVIARSTLAETYTFTITSLAPGTKDKGVFQLDSITVVDRSFENIFPYAAILITFGMTLFVVVSALRERWRQ